MPTTIDELSEILDPFLTVYLMQRAGQEAITKKVTVYLEALANLPAWAVKKATLNWTRGQGITGKENFNFAPNPSQLYTIAAQELKAVSKLKQQAQTLLSAKVIERVEMTESERKDRKVLVHKVLTQHGFKTVLEDAQ